MAKRILIAPLDWGLGHATRCIPIIRWLQENGHEPVVAASGRPLALLREEFPNLEFVTFEGYEISYPEGSGMIWKMFRSTPRILKRIGDEHHELQKLIGRLRLDAVISDNRFGLHSKKVPCVYMTHQVMIKAPIFETLLHRLHTNIMLKFKHVWVPDSKENGLSGDLAHKFPLPKNGVFIGSLSRFKLTNQERKTDVLVIISGPEPQRTKFERLVLEQLKSFDGTALAVLGRPDENFDKMEGKLRVVSHLSAEQLALEIASTELIVSRSGYSTIMDLASMGKKAVFVPTPGQTEQEYLAKKYHSDGLHRMMSQTDFELNLVWRGRNEFKGFSSRTGAEFETELARFVNSL